MLVTIRLSVKAGEQIEALVRNGKYASFEDFARLALENQLVAEADGLPLWGAALRSAVSGTTAEPIVQDPAPGDAGSHEVNPVPPSAGAFTSTDSGQAKSDVGTHEASAALLVGVRSRLRVPSGRVPAAAKPSRDGAEKWPWGQWNRFFPLKLVCRATLCLAKDGTWPSAETGLEEIGSQGQAVGKALIAADLANGRGRDDALAIAFPGADANSVDRFVSQFAGHITKGGPRAGAVCTYQLCALDGTSLALTESGIAFARMTNPFLDGTREVNSLLSSEERQFLIDLIGERVPGERNSLIAVMGAIHKGAKRFDDVVEEARKRGEKSWSDSMARTQVSGTLARLNDLALLKKERQGQIVKYALTSSGEALLHRWRKGE